MLMAIVLARCKLLLVISIVPAKIASIGGNWHTERRAGLRLFGWPSDQEEKQNIL